MAGRGFVHHQGNINPWERDNNQNERFNSWMGPEDRGGLMRRDNMGMDVERSRIQMGMDMDRSRNQMNMTRDPMDGPPHADWFEDEDFMEDRFRNDDRAGGNFTGPDRRQVRRAAKRPKPQQRYDEMPDSLIQGELMNRQESLQKRAREKDYSRDGVGGPYTEHVWDRANPARGEYFHKPSMGLGDVDRSTMRYEDGLPNRPSPNYNFDFTDKDGANVPTVPVSSSWNKPVPAGAENVVIPSAKKKKKKKSGNNANWNGPNNNPSHSDPFGADYLNPNQRSVNPGGESLYTRRPRQPDDQFRHEADARSNWNDPDRPVSNMDVYRMRMAAKASESDQFKRKDEVSGVSHFREKADHSDDKRRDVISAQSTHSIDSDEFLYQDRPTPQHSSVAEPKDQFWENLSKHADERKEMEKDISQKPTTSIGDVLVESLLKHISQKVDSGKHQGPILPKEGGKSTDLAQQLMNLLSNASTESRPKVELKDERKAETTSFEKVPYKNETVTNYSFNRQDDSRIYPANAEPPPVPVSSGTSFSAVSNYSAPNEYPATSVQYPYAPPPPTIQQEYQFNQGPVIPQMQSTYIPPPSQPPLIPTMHHQMTPQPVPPPLMPSLLHRPQIPLMFPGFPIMPAPSPAPFLPNTILRFNVTPDKSRNNSRWGPNSQRQAILTPIPAKVEKKNDMSSAVSAAIAFINKGGKSTGPVEKQQSAPSTSTSTKAVSSSAYKVGYGKFRPNTKALNSSWKGSSSAWKSTSKDASTTSRLQVSTSKDASTTSRPQVSTSKDGASASRDGSSASKDSTSKRSYSASRDASSSKNGNSSASRNGRSTLKDDKSSRDNSMSANSTKQSKPDTVSVPKTIKERNALEEQEVRLRKKRDLLNGEMKRLKSKCTALMDTLTSKERLTDPKLNDAKKLQSEIKSQLSNTNKEFEAVCKALKDSVHLVEKASKEKACAQLMSDKTDNAASKPPDNKTSRIVLNLKPPTICEELKLVETTSVGAPTKQYRFTDNGDHWCKHCNIILPVADDMLKHLQRKHYDVMKLVPPDERPWAEKSSESELNPGKKYTFLPFRGVEFMIPCDSFFCNLCKEFCGDARAARIHLESLKHNANYSKYCKSQPSYAKRIQSLLNSQKKKSSKSKDSPKDSSPQADINILPSKNIKKEPEIIDIDDDDSAAGKESTKPTAASGKEKDSLKTSVLEKEIVVNADVKEPEEKLKDNNEKVDVDISESNSELQSNVKTPDTEKENVNKLDPASSAAVVTELTTEKSSHQESSKSPETSKASASTFKEDNVFEKVSDDEIMEFTQVCKESAKTQADSVFDKISDDEMMEEPQVSKESAKKTEENVFDKISDDEMAEEPENEFEMVTDDEIIDEDHENKGNSNDVDQDTKDMEMKDVNSVEEVDNADENFDDDVLEDFGDDADITIVDDADEDNSEVVIEEADENNDAQEVDEEGNVDEENDCTLIPDKEDEVINNADESGEDAVIEEDELIDNAEDVCSKAADQEHEVVDAVDEDEVMADVVDEDKVEDVAGKDDVDEEMVAEVAGKDDVDEDMVEEVTGNDDEDTVAEVADKDDEDTVAEVADKDEEDKVPEVAGKNDVEKTANEDDVDNNYQDSEIQEENATEESVDNVTTKELAHEGTVSEGNVAIEKANTDDFTKENSDETLGTAAVYNAVKELDTGLNIDKDVADEAIQNLDSGDINLENAANFDCPDVMNNDSQDAECILPMPGISEVGVPQGTTSGDDDASTLEIPAKVPDESDKNNQEDSNKTENLEDSQGKGDGLQTNNNTELENVTVIEDIANPNVSELDISNESTGDICASNLMEDIKEDPDCPPSKRRQVAICSRGRGRGAPRGRGRADTPKAGGENVSPGSSEKTTTSKSSRGAKTATPTTTRVGTRQRSTRQAVIAVAKLPEAEIPSRSRRQTSRGKAPATGVKRDKAGRPIRGKTSTEIINEEDVINLDSPEQTDSKNSSQASGGRSRRKITPRRADLEAAKKIEDEAKAENSKAKEVLPWMITEVVTLDEEETKKLMWSEDLSSGMGSQGLDEAEKMETTMVQEGDEGSNLVELSADEDDSKMDKMEAILLGDPCMNSPGVDEADDACLESDLEIVDEAEDTD